MAVCFNTKLLRSIVLNKYGRQKVIEKILSDWELKFEDPPAPITIRRWMGGSLPQTAGALWQFSSILDVDPLSIIDLTSINSRETDHLLCAYQHDSWSRYKSFKYLQDFLGRQNKWPPTLYQDQYFQHRPWTIVDFSHDALTKKNYYRTVKVNIDSNHSSFVPVTLHIAFMQKGSFSDRWLEFGIITLSENSVQLFHINGDKQFFPLNCPRKTIYFETFFGPRAAEFRVASFHCISLSHAERCEDDVPILRFNG